MANCLDLSRRASFALRKTKGNQRAPRHRFIAGASFVASGQTRACVLVSLSPLGARLHLLAPMALPETVAFHLPGRVVRAEHQRWRAGA